MNLQYLKINDFLDYIGVNDRKTPRFENIWPLPNGVSYNSYLVKDEKNALMDTVHADKVPSFLSKLKGSLGSNKLDYLVIHHMEPDHSGSITTLLEIFPDIKIVGNKKTLEFLEDFYGISENTVEVKEGDVLDLGKRKLHFYKTPMVHWPESMVSYEETSKILFSQDIFGGYGVLDGNIFDDQQGEIQDTKSEIVRYYSNIVGKYSRQAVSALNKLKDLDIDMICPVHGPIWRTYTDKIIDLYFKMAKQEADEGVVIAYGSMYGTNEKMADFLASQLSKEGIKNIKIFDVSKTSPSFILADVWQYKGLILGTCTYDMRAYPKMTDLINILKSNRIDNHVLGIYGSYSWSGGGVEELKDFGENSNFDLLPEVNVKSKMDEDSTDELIQLAKSMAEKIKKN